MLATFISTDYTSDVLASTQLNKFIRGVLQLSVYITLLLNVYYNSQPKTNLLKQPF